MTLAFCAWSRISRAVRERRQADVHRVQLRALQHRLDVAIRLRLHRAGTLNRRRIASLLGALPRPIYRVVAARLIDVAQRADLGAGDLHEVEQLPHRAPTGAHKSESNRPALASHRASFLTYDWCATYVRPPRGSRASFDVCVEELDR